MAVAGESRREAFLSRPALRTGARAQPISPRPGCHWAGPAPEQPASRPLVAVFLFPHSQEPVTRSTCLRFTARLHKLRPPLSCAASLRFACRAWESVLRALSGAEPERRPALFSLQLLN